MRERGWPSHVERVAERESRVPAQAEVVQGRSQEATQTTVVVVDIKGQAISGARIIVEGTGVHVDGLTDSNGEWHSPSLPEVSDPILVDASKDGYVGMSVNGTTRSRIRVVLPLASKIKGHVLDIHERPIAGALVTMTANFPRGEHREIQSTSGDGWFAFSGAPAGVPIQLLACAEGYVGSRLPIVPSPPVTLVALTLERGRVCRGVIRDDNGVPIANATVARADGKSRPCISQLDGTFESQELLEVTEGAAAIVVVAEGYCQVRCQIAAPAEAPMDRQTIVMPRTASIGGLVHDKEGFPLGGIEVLAIEDAVSTWRSRGELSEYHSSNSEYQLFRDSGREALVVTAGDGSYKVDGLVPWSPRVVLRTRDSNGQQLQDTAGSTGPPGSLTIYDIVIQDRRIAQQSVIRGVLLVNGESCGGKVVWQGSEESGVVDADENGRFRILTGESGIVRLEASPVEPEGIYYGSVFAEVFRNVDLAGKSEVEVSLSLQVGLHAVHCEVLPPAGESREGIGLSLLSRDPAFQHSTSTDAQGHATLSALDSAREQVIAVRYQGVTAYYPLADGQTHARLELSRPVVVRVRALESDTGRAIDVVDWSWRQAGTAAFQLADVAERDSSVVANGSAVIRVLPGRIDLRASPGPSTGYLPSWQCGVVAEESRSLDVKCQRSASVRLLFSSQLPKGTRVRLAFSGDPSLGEDPEATQFAEKAIISSEIDSNGVAFFRGLYSGAYSIVVDPPGPVLTPNTIIVLAPRVDLQIRVGRESSRGAK